MAVAELSVDRGWVGVELRHLTALAAIARTNSFVRAARSLGYTQSAISAQIAALERAVGVQLISRARGSRFVHLTPEGEILLAHAAVVTSELERARARLSERIGGESAAAVRLGGAAQPRAAPPAAARTAPPGGAVGLRARARARRGTQPHRARASRDAPVPHRGLAAGRGAARGAPRRDRPVRPRRARPARGLERVDRSRPPGVAAARGARVRRRREAARRPVRARAPSPVVRAAHRRRSRVERRRPREGRGRRPAETARRARPARLTPCRSTGSSSRARSASRGRQASRSARRRAS